MTLATSSAHPEAVREPSSTADYGSAPAACKAQETPRALASPYEGLATSAVHPTPAAARANRGMAMLCVPDDLWANAPTRQGSLQRWTVSDGALVTAGQALAEVRIEDAVHHIIAPAAGQLFRSATPHDTLEPRLLLGFLTLL